MPLQSGEHLGSYEIRAPLGAGGMGEVYRAIDPDLGREVAIKILPPALAADPERLMRFDREARVLASLNHPNIATLFGFEKREKVQYLVMELVEGETLADRLRKGTLPREDLLDAFRQIAEGLEAAHESGVIHRDLKPANIKITPEGKVKLLDFGLAKALEGDGGVASDATMSPTLTAMATQRGEVMGTASYMSPEQARGKPVDRRTDIWAFGCVLYESLTGRLAFGGETISDTISLILQREPDLSLLPADTPPRILDLLQRCFEKNPRKRLRDIGEARLQIERVMAGDLVSTGSSGSLPMAGTGPVSVTGRGRRRIVLAAAAAGIFLAGVLAGAVALPGLPGFGAASEPAAAGVVRFAVDPPEGISMDSPFISPDGKVLAFTGRESTNEGGQRPEPYIYTRRLDELESHRLDATRGVFASTFSADSHWLAFASSASPGSSVQQLRKVPVDGSAPPLVLAEWKAGWRSPIVWPVGEGILLTTSDGKLVRVAPDGSGAGEPLQMKLPEGLNTVGLRSPLPAPGKILASNDSWEGTGYHQEIDLVDAHTGEVRRILDNGTSPRWSPTGHLVFTRNDTLLAMRADPVTFEPAGGVISLTAGLGTNLGDAGAFFDLSQSGTLVYRTGGRWGMHRRLAILSLDGSLVPWSDDRLPFQDAIDVSPDGKWMAVTEMGDDLNFSVWISPMDKPRLRLLAAKPKMDCNNALWAPGSETVYYTCSGRGGSGTVYRARADGASPPEEIVSFSGRHNLIMPTAASPDGRWLLVRDGGYSDQGGTELMKVDLAANKRSLVPFGEDVRESWSASLSPDGRWLAYATRASGRPEIHLRRFAEDGTVGPPAIVTSGDIVAVGWAQEDGNGARDLLFWTRAGKLDRVRISTRPSLSIGDPVEILDGSKVHPSINTAAWMPDGRLLIVQKGEDEEIRRGAVVVVDWLEELKRLARSP